MREYKAAAK